MSRKTRNINTSLWTDDKVANDFTAEEKFFWLYLLTNDNTNNLGAYKLGIKETAFYMGLSESTIRNLIIRFEKEHEMIVFDYNSHEVYIKNWGKYNWTSSKTIRTSLIRQASDLRSKKIKKEVMKSISDFYDMEEKDIKAKAEEEKQNKGKKRNSGYTEEFERFWKVYPKKASKGAAFRAFKKIDMTEELLNEIINKVKLLTEYNWSTRPKEYIPHASTWLNADGWLDEVVYENNNMTGKQKFEKSISNKKVEGIEVL